MLIKVKCCNCPLLLKLQNIMSCSHCLAAVICLTHGQRLPCRLTSVSTSGLHHPAFADYSPNGLACKESCVICILPIYFQRSAGMYTPIYKNIDWNYKQNTSEPSSSFACIKPYSQCLRSKHGKQRNDKGIKHNLAYCVYSQELPQGFCFVWGFLMFLKLKRYFL